MSKRNIAVFSLLTLTVVLSYFIYIVHDNLYFKKTTVQNYRSNMSAITEDARPRYKNKNPLTCLDNTAHPMNQTKKEWEQCLNVGKKPEYYLSIVLVTRMDNYAG